jgi:hypothetical protein
VVDRESGFTPQNTVGRASSGVFSISVSQKLGFVSVPVIGVLAIVFGVLDLDGGVTFQSSVTEAAIGVGAILSSAVIVARISAKSFLATGSSNLLLLGIAVFEFGLSSTIGGFIRNYSLGAGLQIYVLGAFVSACLHVASGILTFKGSPRVMTRRTFPVWFSYIGTVCFVLLLSILALDSTLFSDVGQIGALTQRMLIGSVVAMLLLSGFFFFRVYLRSRSPILYWYSLALVTVAFAFVAFFTTQVEGDLALWTGLGGLCLASLYFLKSVFVSSPRKDGASSQAGRRLN